MLEDYINEKYSEFLGEIVIYENKGSLVLSKIVIKPAVRNEGVGTSILNDIIQYADKNKQVIALTPSNDFGGNKNRLIQFYKRFGFKLNKGVHKNFQFREAMIRYPKLNETKLTIKKLLNEALFIKSSEQHIDLLEQFVEFACKELDIKTVPINLKFDRKGLTTTAAYGNKKVYVYAKDRAIVDIMRSAAHELTHLKQDLEGRLKPENNKENNSAGSEIENEANYKAGEIIRKFGEKNPEIYS